MEQFRASAFTHPGTVRAHNEDMFVNRPDIALWAVADGAGGHEAGEVAAEMVASALQTIPDALTAEETLAQVRLRVVATHAALQELAARKGGGAIVATTLVVLMIRQGHFACLWAGDSRVYLLRGGTLRRVTRDHSLVQELVDAGHLDEREAENHPRANIITRAVGAASEHLELDKVTGPLAPGDRFLLCSDGLSKTVDDPTLAELLRDNAGDRAAETLVSTALARNARDNVTAVVVELVDDGNV